MSRNDNLLATGVTSASIAREQQRTEKRQQRTEQRNKLLPAGEVVNEELQKQIDLLIYGVYPNEDALTDEQFRIERRARRIAVTKLKEIQVRLNRMLREPETKEADEPARA